MAFDDTRYFTFTVKPAPSVLVVSDDPVDARFLLDAIDPDPAALTPGTPRPYRAESVLTSRFSEKAENLGKRYRCIFLNNVSELSETDWGKLSGFVREGGGLVVGLGRRSRLENYTSPTAAQILPATLEKVVAPKGGTKFGDVADFSHPLFSRYPKELAAMLSQVDIARYWRVAPHEGARVLVSYADKDPALVERVFKGSQTGRVLLWTTPLSRRAEPNSPDAWNEFPVSVGWSYYYLMNQSVSYLSGTTEEVLNFEAGKNVVLPLDPTRLYKNYIVQDPERKSTERLSPLQNSDALVVEAPQQIGNWAVSASGTGAQGSVSVTGFSLNPPVSETEFVALEAADLDRLFGEKAYALADDVSKFDQVLVDIRIGRELFPWIMMLIMVVVAVEGVLANRFYRESGAGQGAAVKQPA